MDWVDCFHGFHFDYDSALDHQVDAVSDFEFAPFVDDRQGDLAGDVKATASEFVG